MGICHSAEKRAYKDSFQENQFPKSNTISESKTRSDTQPQESEKKNNERQDNNCNINTFKKSCTQDKPKEKTKLKDKPEVKEFLLNHTKTNPKEARKSQINNHLCKTNTEKSYLTPKNSSIEKRKTDSKSFREEFKLCINNQTLIKEMTGLPTTKYKIISTIGDGSYGTVFLARNVQTKAQVAMKKIDKVKEKEIDDLGLINEVNILKKLDHPNIVKIFEFYDTPTSYFIITEYCKKGELFDYLKNQYTENQLAVLFYQVLSGLVYLHENNIIHRDLKLANILISEIEKDKRTNEDYFVIKIIDFGAAKTRNKNKSERAIVGSSYYMAPEVIKQKYNEKCDTWSIGIILYMLIVGKPPFEGNTDEEIMFAIENGCYNGNHRKLQSSSKEIQDLIRSLLTKNITNRLSAKEALNHPWFKVYNGRCLYSNFEKEEVMPYVNNLMNYKLQSKLQQFVLAFLVHNVSIKNENFILKLFRHFNLEGDCKLTQQELSKGLCAFKDPEEVDKNIDEIFLLLDGDNNGFIEFGEFLRACVDKKEILHDLNLKYAFQFLDKNHQNTISVQSLKKALLVNNNQYEEVFKNTIKDIDLNNDGEITFDEFRQYMLNLI